jgi:AI-2 transport protein TqsA
MDNLNTNTPLKANYDLIFKAFTGILALAVVLKITGGFLLPFVVALFLHLIFYPLIDWMKKSKIPNALVYLVVISITFSVMFVVSILIYSGLEQFIKILPRYQPALESLFAKIKELVSRHLQISDFNLLEQINLGTISGFIGSSIGTFLNFFTSTLLMLVYFIFMLVGHGQLRSKIKKSLNPEQAEKMSKFVDQATKKANKYLLIKTGVSLITGVNAGIILFIAGIDFPFIWGFLTFLFNFIPNIGSPLITILPLILAALKFGSFLPVLILALCLVANQSIVANVIEPRWAGKSLNLSPLLILFSLIVWGWLWGILGMILAVPMMAIIKIALENSDSTRPIALLMESK